MECFTLEDRPMNLRAHRKIATVDLAFITKPFVVMTQEGEMKISPETVDDWDGGYYVAYPSDGSKPYAIAPSFVLANYIVVQG
jgi:hypothetical protein